MVDHPVGTATHEHSWLNDLLAEARAAAPGQLPEVMERLSGMLAAHFGAEEASEGWMSEASMKAPQRTEEIEALQAEHGALLAAVRGFAAGLTDPGALQKLLHALIDHERREAVIISEVLYEELGTGD